MRLEAQDPGPGDHCGQGEVPSLAGGLRDEVLPGLRDVRLGGQGLCDSYYFREMGTMCLFQGSWIISSSQLSNEASGKPMRYGCMFRLLVPLLSVPHLSSGEKCLQAAYFPIAAVRLFTLKLLYSLKPTNTFLLHTGHFVMI